MAAVLERLPGLPRSSALALKALIRLDSLRRLMRQYADNQVASMVRSVYHGLSKNMMEAGGTDDENGDSPQAFTLIIKKMAGKKTIDLAASADVKTEDVLDILTKCVWSVGVEWFGRPAASSPSRSRGQQVPQRSTHPPIHHAACTPATPPRVR